MPSCRVPGLVQTQWQWQCHYHGAVLFGVQKALGAAGLAMNYQSLS